MKASVLSVLFLVGSAMSACTDPKVTASSYTPADSQVLTAIPFIAEFSLACSNGEKPGLWADIDGALVPVAQSIEGDKYQVNIILNIHHLDILFPKSWTSWILNWSLHIWSSFDKLKINLPFMTFKDTNYLIFNNILNWILVLKHLI